MRTLALFTALLFFAVGSAFAQTSSPVTVSLETVKPDVSCSIASSGITLDFGQVVIPWTSPTTKNAQTQVDITVSDATTVTASLSQTTLELETGKVSVSLSLDAPSKSVTPSGSPQTVSFTLSGTATVSPGATPNVYNDSSTQFSITCSN